MTGHPTGTVTFLFTDIEGSTRLAREHPEAWEVAQARHHLILQEAIELNHGVVFQIIGDAVCAAFYKPGDALRAAHQAQQALEKQTESNVAVRVRMGIHTGEAEVQEDGYHGYLTLSLVQRLMSAGHGGQILISGAAENLLRGQLPDGVTLQDMGRHSFKDIPQRVRVFQLLAPDLPTEFPSLRTIDAHPNNLPTQLTSFVGREKELADVQSLLHDTRLLTLIGPGGTGKTRLSIQAANEMLDLYPDGVWLVELAPILDPLLVPRTTAIAIGLRDEPQRPVIDMLCDYLRQKRMLLILDNCEHLVDACARMADSVLHAAPDVRILASSREALGIGGEVTYRVPSLGLPDIGHLPPVNSLSQYEAVKLFIDRARAAVPSFSVTDENAPAVAQICHRLDGIPLAIELAAAKLRVLGVEQVAKRLDDRFRLLTGGSRTALERHQTLRAAIDWSYNLLPPAEQVLFRRLSVFVGGWPLEAAEAVCSDASLQQDDVLNLVEHLINKSIALLDESLAEPRYRMLETIRQYANEKLVESGESNILRDRHLEYFLNLAETAEPHLIRPEQLEWLARLDADYENIRLGLEWALNKEGAESSLRLCAALGWYWSVRGYWVEGARWLKSALAKPGQQSRIERGLRSRALYQDASLANWLDDLERMNSSADQSLKLAEQFSNRRDIAIARFFVGWAADRRVDFERAVPLMEQSLRDFQEISDPYWESASYNWLGNRLVVSGLLSWEEKIQHHLELARKAGERHDLATALMNQAFQLFGFGHIDEAEKYAEEADLLYSLIGSAWNESGIFHAQLEWLRGNLETARAILTQVKERSYSLGDQSIVAKVNALVGCIALDQRNLEFARTHLQESIATVRELVGTAGLVWRLAALGNVYYFEGKPREFKQHYAESLELARVLVDQDIAKTELLLLLLDSSHTRATHISVRLLGALHRFEKERARPIDPIWKRYYDRTEAYAREALDKCAFEAAFTDGQELSLDKALDLVQDLIEAMYDEQSPL